MKDPQAMVDAFIKYMNEREKLDTVAVYEQLKDNYPVTLTMEPCYDYEVPVLHGETSLGKFELWDTGADIIFEIYKTDGSYTHWHPFNAEEAIEAVISFIQGKLE